MDTVLARAIVVAQHGAHDVVKRGDDDDDAALSEDERLGEAEVMPGLGPVPLLQRMSAVESRWTRTVPTGAFHFG